MKKNNIIWKIIQSDNNEYILLSDSDIIKKIKGKNSHDIVSVLLSLQKDTTNVKIREKISIENFEKEYINDIIEWLKHNHFIEEQNISKNSSLSNLALSIKFSICQYLDVLYVYLSFDKSTLR